MVIEYRLVFGFSMMFSLILIDFDVCLMNILEVFIELKDFRG